ncbi:NAD(P)/FAD-dependent oxidoreductase [Celeribacter halophilus]|uniref:NAD(P)/FAD-dependent oxidoreductase n=1 Tax=Celeribacter halophilus TaxID=576117 RepID=UPI001C0962DE|nr:FAD-dependent oxidoreductase [Celeribacter halophilus]MBU2891374.1 FAD-dependent oxidoreductase [Celeribacter halophilus]MDO6512390.1 FAD-dependent oxidoreductase [Celeribacter halophilus]
METCERFVIVGASLTGLRAAEALRDNGYSGEITLVGDEAHQPYNRPPLSKQILIGSQSFEDLVFPIEDSLSLTWRLGAAATGLNISARQITLADGDVLPYDRLLIATGVTPFVPPIPNVGLSGIHALRTIDDAKAMNAALQPGQKIAIVGAGFIGCEVAASAKMRGLDVTVIDQMERPMSRVLPTELSQIFRDVHEEEGVSFRFGARVSRFEGSDQVTGVTFEDGETIAADLVLVAVGSQATTGWLEGSGLELRNGVVCDAQCRARNGEGRIAAAGDIAIWPHPAFGNAEIRIEHWTNASEQGAAAALTLIGVRDRSYVPLPSFWSDQFALKLQSIGRPADADRIKIVAGALEERKLLAECWCGEELIGAIAINMAPKLARYRRRMEEEYRALSACNE